MNIAVAKKEIQMAINTKWTTLLIGQPGIGKTDMCQQVAEEAGMDFLTEIATTSEPTDIKGLPSVVNGKADYLPYGFLRRLLETTKPTLVLVDDLGHAGIEVQKAYMHLLLARKVNEHRISDSVAFVAATNDVGQRAGVTGIISPLQNRMYQVRVEPDTKLWCDWAVKRKLAATTVGFVRSTPTLFEEWKPPVGIEATCTPRSMKMLSDFYEAGATSIETYTGCVGQKVALQFAGYVQLFRELPSVQEIINRPTKIPIPKELDRKHGICAALACSEVREEVWSSIVKYLNRLPIEFQVSCITDGHSRNKELLTLPSVRDWVKKNQSLLL